MHNPLEPQVSPPAALPEGERRDYLKIIDELSGFARRHPERAGALKDALTGRYMLCSTDGSSPLDAVYLAMKPDLDAFLDRLDKGELDPH